MRKKNKNSFYKFIKILLGALVENKKNQNPSVQHQNPSAQHQKPLNPPYPSVPHSPQFNTKNPPVQQGTSTQKLTSTFISVK